MWIRIKETGLSEFVIDLTAAFGMIDAGTAEAIGDLPERPAIVEAPAPKPRKAK